MKNRSNPSVATALLATAAAVALTALGACGGDPGQATAEARLSAQAVAVTPVAMAAPPITAPLLDDEGRFAATDPRAAPEDPGARTRAGRYASEAQARQLTETLGAQALELEVECCGSEAVDRAVGVAWGLQAAHDLPQDTPVLVRGKDLRLAAVVANRLAGGGLTHVWLVTP